MIARPDLGGLNHQGDSVGLRDGLALTDRQRPVLVGKLLEAGLNEGLARHASHGIQDGAVAHAASGDLNFHHVGTGAGEIEHGRPLLIGRRNRLTWTQMLTCRPEDGVPQGAPRPSRALPMRPWSLSMSTWTLRLSAGVASKKAAISPRRLGWFSFTARTKSAPLPVIAFAMVGLQAMASMVTSAPSSAPAAASRSRSVGIAFCSQDLSATASWPSTRRSLVAKAETRCSACLPAPRSWLRREVLPSMATSWGASGQVSRTQLMKQVENTSGSTRFISVRSQSAQGMP